MLKPGDVAPEFELPDETGMLVRLSSLLARGPVVVYFYPADGTRVCTAEACMFRDVYSELAAAGVQVVGISPQSVESKARFKAALDATGRLPFPLLADVGREVARKWGALGLLGLPILGGVRRVTYLVGKDGRIVDVVAAELSVGRHEEFVRKVLDSGSRDQVR